MEKGKISSFQMALMIVPTIIATAILIVPSITGKFAGRDMWISPILASLNGFFTAFLMYRLHKIYPNKTFIQYSEHIIGRIPGKVLGFVYLFFFCIRVAQYVESTQISLLVLSSLKLR